MEKIEIKKTIPIIGQYDVVVCGGGPAGVMAAIAASRGGAKTALIERYGFTGGMATAGMVAPISVFMYNGELVVGGIPWEFVKRLESIGGAKIEKPLGNISFAPEAYKLVAQRMLLEAGVELYLHAFVSGCETSDGQINQVVFESKSGTQALIASYVIDCTGDADIAFMAHVPMQLSRDELQPASLIFCLGNVDTDNIEGIHHSRQGVNYHNRPIQKKLLEIAAKQQIPNFGGPWFCWMMSPGFVLVNMTRKAVNMVDERAQTIAECTLREDAHRFVSLLRENFEPFRNAILVSTATQVGVRETRRIAGVHVLTGEEYAAATYFSDAIARGAHPIDIHSSDGSGQKCQFLEKAAYIPYRSLIVKDYSNIIVAGRCFSADREASASARVQATAMAIGQAAGSAAAICVNSQCSVHDLEIVKLQQQLIELGANLTAPNQYFEVQEVQDD